MASYIAVIFLLAVTFGLPWAIAYAIFAPFVG